VDTGIQNIPENQEMLYLNTFKDKHYPSVLAVLGVMAFISFIALIFSFVSSHWILGIIFSVIALGLFFVVFFCAKGRSFSNREEINRQKEAGNEKKL